MTANRKTRILAWLLTVLTVLSVLPTAAWADVETRGACGAQGDNVGWAWSSANGGTLSIGGEGAMADYDGVNPIKMAPWSQLQYTTVKFGGSITHIGAYSFSGSQVGKFLAVGHTVSLPSTVTSIGQGAFYACVWVQRVQLPGRLTALDSHAFKGCDDLRTITLPAGVTRIENETFMGCERLESVVIQAADLSYIGADAFLGCTALKDVYFRGTRAQWNKIRLGSGNTALLGAAVHFNYTDSVVPTLDTPAVTVSRDTATDKPRVSWTAVPGAAQYEVYRSAAGASGSYSIVRRTEKLEWVDDTAQRGSTYYYTVRAINGTAVGLKSDPCSMRCPAVPSVPTVTLSTNGSGKPSLRWTSAADAAQYEVWRSATGKSGSYSIVRRTEKLEWVDEKTEMGKTYYYVVRGINGNLCGKFSKAATVTCPIILSAPTVTLDVDRATGAPQISWEKVPFAAQYEVWRSATGKSGSYRIIRRTAALTYTDTAAANGENYYYVVRAMRGTGSTAIYSKYSAAQRVAGVILPSRPTVTLGIDSGSGKPVISWGAAAHAAQYEVWRSATGNSGSYRIIRRTAMLTYTDSTAEAGKTYYYVVRGMSGTAPDAFYGKYSAAQSIRCETVPAVPVMSVTADDETGRNVIRWEKASHAAQYEVYRAQGQTGYKLVRRTAGTTWVDTDTEYGVTYSYKVRAVNGAVKSDFCGAQSIVCAYGLLGSGSCGSVTWEMLANGTLFLSGSGTLYTYDYLGTYKDTIKRVIIRDGVTAIGEQAFSGCTALTEITLPDSVTSIGWGAFEKCTALTKVTLPDGLTGIAHSTFYCCSALTKVTIPDSVTTIGSSAFYGCDALTEVTIPDGVTTIADSTFYGCDSLAEITIPDSVTAIGASAFYLCTALTEITLPDSVTSIGWGAFEKCTALTELTLPDGLTDIGASAFYLCENLTEVMIPNSVTTIGAYAFSCTGLTKITIPTGVTGIEKGTFLGCNALTEVTIPGSVTSIGDSAFYSCDKLQRVILREGVAAIGSYAFAYCRKLGVVALPASLRSIGSQAFYDTITGMNYVSGIYYGGSESDWKNIEGETPGCYEIRYNYTAPAAPVLTADTFCGYPAISWNAVDGADRYDIYRASDGGSYQHIAATTELSYRDYTAEKGEAYSYRVCAFAGALSSPQRVMCTTWTTASGRCGNQAEWILSSAGTLIIDGKGDMPTFDYQSGGYYQDPIISYPWRNYVDRVRSVVIRSGITGISDYAFLNHAGVTSVTIPETVTSIGYSAFRGCTALTAVTLPEGIDVIHQHTFYRCSALTEIAIPRSVKTIEIFAFGDKTETAGSGRTIYYGGTADEWAAVTIEQFNSNLTGGAIRYDQTEPWR